MTNFQADIRIDPAAEKNHPLLVGIAADVAHAMPGKGGLVVANAGDAPPARRHGDRVLLLQNAGCPALLREGTGRITIRYDDVRGQGAAAAVVAAVTPAGMPVCADAGSAALLALAARVATSEIPVLIDGPTGTGKEVLARFIHNRSPRRTGPFVAINCAAMPEAMLEALLFGHLKGAFTGAAAASEGFFRAADGGTLLLDEIAEMPIGLQAKLLRVLQEGEVVPIGATSPVKVDVRIIAAANRDLPTEVAEGRLRADLFYRLNVFPLSLAALRERRDDIAPLAFAMVLRHGPPSGPLPWIAEAALDKLQEHAWPGNIRELENVLRRALLLADGTGKIEAEHITFDKVALAVPVMEHDIAPLETPQPERQNVRKLASIVRQSEAQAIIRTLDECGGHRIDTARRLGISERTLRYRLADIRDAGLAFAGAAR
ncbi:MAG: sigma 54-interacting transcriptional regulator [Allopontixanthobacter sediminis]